MNKTKLRAFFVIGAVFMLALTVLFGMQWLPQRNAAVHSTPDYDNQNQPADTLEHIPDSTTPLASPQDVQSPASVELTSTLSIAPAQANVPIRQSQQPASEGSEEAQEPEEQQPEEKAPADESTVATRLLDRANALLAEFYACQTTEEKRALLEATNNSLGNDAMRAKLLADLGGSWEQLEDEIVDATQYQQDKTLYVQVYMSGLSDDYVPVVYTTQNSDRSGNQWSTNLVYDAEDAAWMEYTQKHPYNDSRQGFYMTTLYNNEDGYDELKDTMEASDVWQEVVVPEDAAGAVAPDASDPGSSPEG